MLPLVEPISSQLRHDLRGAVVNISGFHCECALATAELRQVLEAHLDGLPDAARASVMQLIDDDLLVCLGFLAQSISQLEGVIEATGDSASAGADHAD